MAQRQSRHSFALLSALLLATHVAAKAVSTSVFPNTACAGEDSFVGIGRVNNEAHCGCTSDNLPDFEACPSSDMGESVCNSVLDLESGLFTASCAVVACEGTSCPTRVVNTVVVDGDDCYASGKGAIGYITEDGQSKCACSGEADDVNFSQCPTIPNGRSSCVAVDNDFLGMTYSHKETVECGVTCDEGYTLTSAGTCSSLVRRAGGDSRPRSASWTMPEPEPTTTTTHRSHSQSHHSRTRSGHNGGHSTTITSVTPPHSTGTPSTTTGSWDMTSRISHRSSQAGHATATPKAHSRRDQEEIVFADVCAADERTCTIAGDFGDFSCVRLDDVTECGGCHSTGDAVNCMEIPGIASAACLRGGCVVRSCQPGYTQTSEGECTLKA